MGRTPLGSLGDLTCRAKVIIVAGSGGVGKTTVAAALGLSAADVAGRKVLVITVDPAKRLADSLGLEHLTSQGTRIANSELAEALGHEVAGELFVAMLDAKSSWDELVRRHAPDATTRNKILTNPIYKNVSARFVQSHDYIAMETLYELHRSHKYDLIVVDTPPSRHAIDFLDAPAKMAEFFSSKLVRWLTLPARNRLLMGAFRPFYQVADKILGAQFLTDVAEFFLLFQSMYQGFVSRAESVSSLLGDDTTSFVVVSSPEPSPMQEAEYFFSALEARHLHLGQMVINKALPAYFRDPEAILAAHKLQDRYEQIAEEFLEEASSLDLVRHSALSKVRLEALTERVLLEISGSFLDYSGVAIQEAEEVLRLPLDDEVLTFIPHLNFDVADLVSLGKVARYLISGP